MKLLMKSLSLLAICSVLMLTSCIKKKDFLALQENKDLLQSTLEKANEKLNACEDEKTSLQGKVADLESTVAKQNSALSGKDAEIKTLQGNVAMEQQKREMVFSSLSDMSVMSESEVKQFRAALEKINGMPEGARNEALTKALTENLTKSLGGVASKDVQVTTKGGTVFISLSDKVLYNAGRSALSKEAKMLLDEIAKVIQANSGIDVLIEGHADADPIKLTSSRDNWDLSVKRAMKVANYLEKTAEVSPSRLVVAGRGEHNPKADNLTEEGKAMNRRTEIMLVPGLDQYFRLVTGQ